MNETIFSILLFILGLIIGVVVLLIINYLRTKEKEKAYLKQKKNLINLK